MNRIFFKYIARSFWAPFGFGLAVFCLLLLFGSLFDNLNFFMRSGAGAGVFARYVLFQAPYFAVKMTPIATLLAVLFALGGMIAGGEWKAGLAGGWRPFDMIKPLLLCSLLAGAGQFVVQEALAPGLYLRSTHLFEEKLRGRQDWQRLIRKNVTFSAGEETFVTASVFDGLHGTMSGAIVDTYRGGRLWMELNAASARWDQAERRWTFENGVLIKYDEDRKPQLTRFTEYRSLVAVPPEGLVLENLVPEGVSSLGLLRRLARMKAVGAPSTEERTLLWVKLAAPFSNPAMALIGAAIVLLIKKNNKFFSFGLALGVGFFFWAVIILAQGAGDAEMLPPVMAGFSPALCFALFSYWGLRRARAV